MTPNEILTLVSTAEGREVIGDWYEENGRLDIARLYRDELPEREGPLRKRVESLTEEELAQLDEHARQWIAVGRCTEPADREKAEAALLACYRYAGLHPPKRLVWAPSPLVACLAGAQATLQLSGGSTVDGAADDAVHVAVHEAVREAVHEAVHGEVRDKVHAVLHGVLSDAVHSAVHEAVYFAMHGAVRDAVHVAVHEAVREAVHEAVHGEVRDAMNDVMGVTARGVVRDLWWRYLGAQFLIGLWWWGPASVNYALDVLRLDIGRDLELRARAYAALCESCFLVWPHREFAVLCERPRVLELEGPGETVEQMRRQRLIRVAWEGWKVVP